MLQSQYWKDDHDWNSGCMLVLTVTIWNNYHYLVLINIKHIVNVSNANAVLATIFSVNQSCMHTMSLLPKLDIPCTTIAWSLKGLEY